MRLLVVLSLTLLSNFTNAAEMKSVVGTIDKVQLMGKNYASYTPSGDAIVFIHMDALPVSCDNSSGWRRVAITSNHPAFETVVSTALAAKLSGATVELRYLNECTLWSNSAWDFAIITVQ